MGYRNYSTAASRIVDTNGSGDFTTIAAALTAATSGQTIFIRPGTYAENLTLKAGVNLTAYPCDAFAAPSLTPNVIILGKCTATFVGTCAISGIQLKTNSDFCLSVTGSSATQIFLKDCYIDANNNTAIQFTSSSGTSAINFYDCIGEIDTTGIAYFTMTAAGALEFFGGRFTNNGNSTTASTNSSSTAGAIAFRNMYWNNAITTSNAAQLIMSNAETHQPFIINGTGTNSIDSCQFDGGSSSAISIGTGATLTINSSVIFSSNTNPITGLGTIIYSDLSFSGSVSIINTTTQTPNYTQLGKFRAGGQPCFQAYLSSTQANKTGDGTVYTILFDTVVFDQNSNYTSGSGTFTAPVTGKYLFTISIQVSSLSVAFTELLASIVTTAATYGFGACKPLNFETNSGSATLQVSGSIIANMTANDTATVTIDVVGATKTVGVFGGRASTNFSGCLIA